MNEELPLDSYVELRPGYEDVYARAYAGSRGWVRDKRTDEWDFDEVYIEWDKGYARYNGEPDGWTFAVHFMLSDGPVPVPSERDWEAEVEEYIDQITDAFDKAAESDGFFLITMRKGYVMDMEVIAFDTYLGSPDDDIRSISKADILRFVGEQMRKRND